MSSAEDLREALLDAERALQRERQRRLEAEALLASHRALTLSDGDETMLPGLLRELGRVIAFDHVALLEGDVEGELVVSSATSPVLNGVRFRTKEMFGRVLSGQAVAVFDVARVPEWSVQDASVLRVATSALHVPLRPGPHAAMLICTHSQRGFFTQREVELAERLAPLVSQALLNRDLLRTEAGLRQFIDRCPEPILVQRRRLIVYVNDAMVSAVGYLRDELMGRDPIELLVHPDDRRRLNDQRGAAGDGSLLEYRWVRRDGVALTFEGVGVNITFEGTPARIVFSRELTERRRIQAELILADRMRSVGTLAAGVAHELNNPLAYVVANLTLLAEELRAMGTDPSGSSRARELRAMVDDTRQGAERMAKIIRGMKAFSRVDEDVKMEVSLVPVLDAAINLTLTEIRHRARLVKDYAPTPSVLANDGRLTQVFVNLLVNAAHAIEEGHTEQNEIRVHTRTGGSGGAVIEVSDTGAGIRAEAVGRVFDPFFTTKPVGVGTGLGLSICHNIVASLGGEITVESVLGRGTTFRVSLPPLSPEQSIVPVERAASIRPPTRRARVLVIDDDVLVATSFRRTLKEHDVTVVTEARAALGRLLAGEQFDALICDLMMPDMTGMDLYAALSEALPDVLDRIIFVTGGAFTPAGVAFLDSVPNPRLEKPYDLHNLRALIQSVVR